MGHFWAYTVLSISVSVMDVQRATGLCLFDQGWGRAWGCIHSGVACSCRVVRRCGRAYLCLRTFPPWNNQNIMFYFTNINWQILHIIPLTVNSRPKKLNNYTYSKTFLIFKASHEMSHRTPGRYDVGGAWTISPCFCFPQLKLVSRHKGDYSSYLLCDSGGRCPTFS